MLDRRFRLAFWADARRAALTVGIGVVGFLLWDLAGLGLGIFARGDSPHMTGLLLAPELPVEEAFFLALLCYTALLAWRGAGARGGAHDERRAQRRSSSRCSAPSPGRCCAACAAGRSLAPWCVLCVLTMVFDTLMIAAGLYVFDPDKILGVYIWGAPLEDFAYAIAAAVGMPVLWTVLGRRKRGATSERGPRGVAPVLLDQHRVPVRGGLPAGHGRADRRAFVVGTLFFLVPYNLLMYGINDVFDYASDLRNPRKGGIEGGLVAARARARCTAGSCGRASS